MLEIQGNQGQAGQGHPKGTFGSPSALSYLRIELKADGAREQYIINASQPASDKIFDVSAFEKFLQDKIKVENRVGNLGDKVEIKSIGDGKIEVVA